VVGVLMFLLALLIAALIAYGVYWLLGWLPRDAPAAHHGDRGNSSPPGRVLWRLGRVARPPGSLVT
jgi:hypothetical protein